MKGKEYINGLGFNISNNPRTSSVWLRSWDCLISIMLYDGLIEIWHNVQYSEISGGSLLTNLTPTIRKLSSPPSRKGLT